jgi:hypothetical protein
MKRQVDLGSVSFNQPERAEINWLSSDPESYLCQVPAGESPKEIVNFWLSVQKKTYGITLLDLGFTSKILQSHIKGLLKSGYSPDIIKRGILLASQRVRGGPFSIRWLKVYCQRLQE